MSGNPNYILIIINDLPHFKGICNLFNLKAKGAVVFRWKHINSPYLQTFLLILLRLDKSLLHEFHTINSVKWGLSQHTNIPMAVMSTTSTLESFNSGDSNTFQYAMFYSKQKITNDIQQILFFKEVESILSYYYKNPKAYEYL